MDCHNKCDIGNMYKFQEDLGYDLHWLGDLLNPLGCALGIWIVGNIGRYGCVVISSYMLLCTGSTFFYHFTYIGCSRH